MKNLIIAVVIALIAGCATTQGVDHGAANAAASRINAQYESGQITLTQREQGFVDLVRAYYPNDALSLNCQLERLYLAQDYDGKKINAKQFEDGYTASLRRCEVAMNNRNATVAAQDAERQRMREAAAGAAFLNGVGRGFANAYGQNVGAPAQPNYGYQPGGGCIYKAGVLVCP